ncbi:hypothetical protein BDR03DRAFT_968241, partial [Suillus americanus]
PPPKPTEESSHSPSLLAYDALPNHQDFDSMTSDTKFTAETRTELYDCGLTSRKYALVGVACSTIFSCLFIVLGIVTLAHHGISGVTMINMTPVYSLDQFEVDIGSRTQVEILALTLNTIVMLCTESIGFVHGISLRSALASESRLRFNTNLRLLTAARGWCNPNGVLLNGISAVLLIISYSSASLVACLNLQTTSGEFDGIAIAGLPLIVLGVVLLLQVMIALSGMRAVKILTWSSSPFDLTATLVHHTQLTSATLRCMRPASDLDTYGPAKPSEIQPSAWHAHPSIRKVVISLWAIVAACAGWAALIMYIWDTSTSMKLYSPYALTLQTWSFFSDWQNSQLNFIFYDMPVIQGPLTLGLHCSELIANAIRDERQWRCATGRKGLRTATNPVKAIFTHPICLILFVAKPFLHWMFGLSLATSAVAYDEKLIELSVIMCTAQIWNSCIALFIFACFFTFVALHRPRGPQPAAYGHVQTLANLEDGIPYCHAGTSDHPLPDVKMDCVYAGSGAGSVVPLS